MKIDIGKYPSRLICRLHDRHMNKKYNFDWPEKQTNFENALEKLESAIQCVYNVVNQIYFDRQRQKVSVKIHDYDTWDMSYTLTPIILPMLKQLKTQKQGAPNVDIEDVPESLHGTPISEEEKLNGGIDDKWFERWDYIIDEMIWAFETYADENREDKYRKWEEDPSAHFGMKLVSEDREGLAALNARIENGFRLFGKYFQCLWS